MKALLRMLVDISKAGRRILCCAGAALMIMPSSVKGAASPTKGTLHNLVILCQFSDHADGSTNVPDKAVYEARYNTVGGHSLYAPGGSVRDFFFTNSYGQLTLTSTILGWVKLPKESSYYARRDGRPRPPNWMEFHTNALAQIALDLDFKRFDSDNNGEVDYIQFIHSGPDLYQNYAGSLGSRKFASREGIKVKFHVNLSSAYSTVAKICHEMGHQMGLFDQYDRDRSSAGLGFHCLMAAGNKGWRVVESDYAASPCAWCKVELGWVNPTVLDRYGVYTARSSATFPDIFKITNGYNPGEYLLIENRQPLCFYQGPKLPKGGLAIWHIDESKRSNDSEGYPGMQQWPRNGRHYKIALLQADGAYHLEKGKNWGDAWDYYYGGHTNTVLGQGPLEYPDDIPFPPNTDSYMNGVVRRTPNQVSHISPPGPEMSFTYENPRKHID